MSEILIADKQRRDGAIFILIDDEEYIIKFMAEDGEFMAVELPEYNMRLLKDFLINKCKVDFSKGEI